MVGTRSAKPSRNKRKNPPAKRGFSIFQIVTGVVMVGLVVVLAFQLAPPIASFLVSASIVGATFALQTTGRI